MIFSLSFLFFSLLVCCRSSVIREELFPIHKRLISRTWNIFHRFSHDNDTVKCHKKPSTGRNKFLVDPAVLDKDWKMPFRNASKIWKDFIPWIDHPLEFSQMPPRVQKNIENFRKFKDYNITYTRTKPCYIRKAIDLFCVMKRDTKFRTITYNDPPFHKKIWEKYLPKRQMHKELPRYKSCAVVSSSSSLKNLGLGSEIDRHDAVIRFNFAPIKGYEADVGNKSTIYVFNSMAFTTMYDQVLKVTDNNSIILLWDPSNYSDSLEKWYNYPQHRFHDLFMDHVDLHPHQKAFILDPRSIWSMWKFLQDNTGDMIQRTMTSSGFMGNILAMTLCDVTHVYGYLPSPTSITKKCYYFKDYEDICCTYGAFHPILYEKNIMVQIKQGPRDDVYEWGRITLPGFNDFLCVDYDDDDN